MYFGAMFSKILSPMWLTTDLRSWPVVGLSKSPSLPKLRVIDASGAGEIKLLPEDLSSLVALETINLAGCKSLLKLPTDFGGAEARAEAVEAEAEEAVGPGATDAEAAEAAAASSLRFSKVPGLKLARIDLTGCEKLSKMPDLSHLAETCTVVMDGVSDDLVMGWERGMRKAFSSSR